MTTPRPRRSAASGDTTRTSSDDRDVVVGLLNDAYSRGRLEPDEYQARLDLAMRTGTYAELYRVLDGLPIDARRLPRPPQPRRPRWVVPAAIGGVVLVGAGAALLVGRPDEDTDSAGTPVTVELEPSPTPRASVTAEPSPSAAAPASPSPSAAAGTGTPSAGSATAVTRSGTGTTIVTVPWAAGVAPMIEFEVERDDYELFTLADADGNPFFTYASVDGRGGRSTGVTVVPDYVVPTDNQLRVKVETEGSWTITLRDVADAPVLGPTGSGTGYVVGWYDGPEGVFSMSADEGNFAVWDDWRLVVNGIGPERDEGVIDAGRRLLRIEAPAPWRYEIR